MYRCEDCGNTFPYPVIRESWEPRPDGWLEHQRYVVCPWCSYSGFKEAEEEWQEIKFPRKSMES